MNRRKLLTTSAVIAGAVLAPSAIWLAVRQQQENAPNETRSTLLDALCDLVIPATDTPGALAVGVPAFVRLALDHGLGGAQPRHLEIVAAELVRRGNAEFATIDISQQSNLLAALDADAYQQSPSDEVAAAWRLIKQLILLGYYTSEAGATRELRYQLVPGRFDSDVTLAPDERAWASDWVAVS